MLEPITVGILANGLAAGASMAAGTVRDKIKGILRGKRYSEQIDTLAAKFNDALRKEVPKAIEEAGVETVDLEALEEDWNVVAEHLDQIDVAFEDDRDAAGRIARGIEDALELDLDEGERKAIEDGVLSAYRDAVRAFAESLDDDLAHVLQTEADIELTSTVNRLEDRIETFRRRLRVGDLHGEGFDQVDPLYFERHQPGDPLRAWGIGFDLVEVDAGYPLDRQRPARRGDERRAVSDEVVERLETGENLVVLGQRGSGKSTVCRAVACEWHEDDRGPIFYRDSVTETTFDDPGALVTALRTVTRDGGDGETPLVVVEDCVDEGTRAIYEVLKEFADDVAFLFDAREGEWHDADDLLDDARSETLRQGLGVVTMPALDAEECQRAVDHFEGLDGVDREVGRDGESLYAAVRSADVGGPLMLAYELTGPAGEDEESALWKDVRNAYSAYDEWTGDGWAGSDLLRRQIGVFVNVLNAAQLPVGKPYLYAIADSRDETYEIDEALDRLEEAEVLFEDDDGNEGYRAPHETWSSLYLERVLSDLDERRAVGLFEECVDALFGLADDAEERERVRGWLWTDSPALDRIEEDPEDAADRFVRQVARIGTEHPPLAPLFGTSNASRISLPAACSEQTRLHWHNQRGLMHRDRSDFEAAETELERLRTLVENSDGLEPDEADRRRSWALGNLGLVARKRGDLDAAEEYHEESLAIKREVGDRHGQAKSLNNLGLVARQRGDLETARSRYEDATNQLIDIGAIGDAGTVLDNLVGVCEDLGDTEAAREWCKRAIAVAERAGREEMREEFEERLASLENGTEGENGDENDG